MRQRKAEQLAAEYGASIDWMGSDFMLDAKPGHWFPSNTTHCVVVRPGTVGELLFWLNDMERCGSNDCEVCVDTLTEMPAPTDSEH